MIKDTKEGQYDHQQQFPYGSPRSTATNGDGVLIPDKNQQAQYNYSPVYQYGASLPYAPQCHDVNGVIASYFQPQYRVTHHFVAVHHHAVMIPQNLSQDFFFDQSQKFYDHVNEPQLHMQHQYPNSSQQNCPNLIEVQKRRSRRSKRRFRRSRQRSSEFNAQQSEKASPNSCHEIMDIKKICSNESSDISTIATMESSSVKTNM